MKNVLIVGAGKRVQDAALPALGQLPESYRVEGVLARTARELQVGEASYAVERLADLTQERLDGCELVYMVVGKNSVPAVLKALCALDASRVDLLIDTPVLLFKHMGHLGLLERFRNVWVPEDCTTLPAYDPIDELVRSGSLGAVRRVVLDRSGYAYHAVAMGRRLLAADRVRSARRRRRADGTAVRRVRFATGGELEVLEPRDYAAGRITIEGSAGVVTDDPARAEGDERAHLLAAVVEGDTCVGFRAGEVVSRLTGVERALMGTARASGAAAPGVTVWMDGMKRVGFLRLLERIDRGEGAHALADALEDTIVDYHLEKIGRYVVNPITSAQFASARWVMRVLTRVTGG